MDITDLTLEEIQELIGQLTNRHAELVSAQQEEASGRRAKIGEAIGALDTLLGPEEGAPGIDDIRSVRRYDEQTMADNAGLALTLAFIGLEQLTTTVRDLALVVANTE